MLLQAIAQLATAVSWFAVLAAWVAVAAAASAKVVKAMLHKSKPGSVELPQLDQPGSVELLQLDLPGPKQPSSAELPLPNQPGHAGLSKAKQPGCALLPQRNQPVPKGLGYPQQPGSRERPHLARPGPAQPPQPSQPGGGELLHLPCDVLDIILAKLQVQDRFRFMACCRGLRLRSANSASLWADISARLGSTTRLHQFATALGRPGVTQLLRRLRITSSGSSRVSRSQGYVDRLVLLLASASSLELLDWTLPKGVSPRLGAWAGVLPRLRSLSLTIQGARLELPACLGPGLSSLQELRMYELNGARPLVKLAPGCLPPSLRHLELCCEPISALPPVNVAATQLTELSLRADNRSIELEGLVQLTGLRRLALWHIAADRMEPAFGHVARLPLLESLDLAGDPWWAWLGLPSFDGITQLRSLRELYLGGRRLEQLPEGLLRTTSLEALHLEGNPGVKLLAASARACRLQLLTLDAEAAACTDNLLAIASMSHLQQLRISNSEELLYLPLGSLLALVTGLAQLGPVHSCATCPRFCYRPVSASDAANSKLGYIN